MKLRSRVQFAPETTDAELFAALSRGDLSPLGVLFDRYCDDVRQFFQRAAPLSADVDDLVQETFLTAARAAGSYDGREVARPFLIGVGAQLLRHRRRNLGRLFGLLEAFGSAPVPHPATPEDAVGLAKESTRLHAAMARLSEDRRLVLVMVEWQGMSGIEVAKALGLPPGTVWRRLHEARRMLRRTLERGAR